MPLPTPNPGESHDEFMSRCHAEIADEFPDETQRHAVCESQWDGGGATAQYPLVSHSFLSTPWAIMPETMSVMARILSLRISGERLTPEEIQANIGAVRRPQPRASGGIAVIPVMGVLSHRMNLMTEMSGGTSTQKLSAQLREAVNNPDVGNIVLDIDSPGGSVQGIPELAMEIREARQRKPVLAVANARAASAAYWLASQATEVVVTPSGDVGSIGVIAAHDDVSKALEMDGINTTLMFAGKNKARGSPLGPLSDEDRAFFQEQIDAYYKDFVDAVARGRGVARGTVLSNFGQGDMVLAKDAVERGMADRVATMSQTLERLGVRTSNGGAKAEAEDGFTRWNIMR